MSAVFDLNQTTWSFHATPSEVLRPTKLPIVFEAATSLTPIVPAHDASYWALHTTGYDWSAEDRLDADAFNRVLWAGLAGSRPFPARR